MNHAAVTGLLAGCIAALLPQSSDPSPAALQNPSAQNPSSNTERVETGTAQSAAGNPISYRIRLLPLTSFPDLPPPVAAELARRHCMIPQSFEAKQPENIIHGAFHTPGSSDWAALCSASGATTLFVFFAGQFEAPISLRAQPDSMWLGAEPGSSVFGSAWGIAVRTPVELRASRQLRHALPIDHDAIEDAHLERSETVHYYQAGKWIALSPGDTGD